MVRKRLLMWIPPNELVVQVKFLLSFKTKVTEQYEHTGRSLTQSFSFAPSATVWMFLCPPNSRVDTLILKVGISRRGFRRWLDHEAGALMTGSVPLWETPPHAHATSIRIPVRALCVDTAEVCDPGGAPLLALTGPRWPPELWRRHSVVCGPPGLWCLLIEEERA